VHEDASTTRLNASSGTLDAGGSVQFFGLLSVAQPFVAVRFGNSAPVGYDGFVFDDLVVADATQLAAVPEPGAGLLMLAGMAGIGMLRRRRPPGRQSQATTRSLPARLAS